MNNLKVNILDLLKVAKGKREAVYRERENGDDPGAAHGFIHARP